MLLRDGDDSPASLACSSDPNTTRLLPTTVPTTAKEGFAPLLTLLLLRSLGDGCGGLRVLLVLPFLLGQVGVGVVVAQAWAVLVALSAD